MARRGEVLRSPSPDVPGRSTLGAYLSWLDARGILPGISGLPLPDAYQRAWHWSVTEVGEFWDSVRAHFAVELATEGDDIVTSHSLPGARFFPGATLNYARHALRGGPGGRATGDLADAPAVVARSQTRDPVELTWAELADQVGRCRAGLRDLGVGRGDRVAAYLPNIPETVVAMLATASLGAVWSSCPPEFGIRSVTDRLRQIEPAVLLTVDGYRYGDKSVSRLDEVAAIRAALPDLRATVTVPYLDPDFSLDGATPWDELLGGQAEPPSFEPVPFDHPLYVLYSSGTTGLPKPIVHGHGGILLEHLKVLGLHGDLGPGDRFLWFSTTGWMMWNYLVSGLLVGATVVLFDGDPGHPDLGELWRLAGELDVGYFGVSAPYLMACRKAGVAPARLADLSSLRTVGSTGAPLPADGFRWVYEQLGPEVWLSSVSGGTDLCTAFVGGHPASPVRAGEISSRYLGADVRALGQDGTPVVGEEGELVIGAPMPSMPVGFWGDEDGSRYRAAYFDRFPGMWAHGDWITIHEDGACLISGRSDATLNRGGVRMGTAELYAVVEGLPEVADSLVVHHEDPDGGPGRLLLFVAPAPGTAVDDELRQRIAGELRRALSPRHVPDELHEVPGVPRTLSGKKLEVPIKRILAGEDPERAASRGSLANPEALDAFVALAR